MPFRNPSAQADGGNWHEWRWFTWVEERCWNGGMFAGRSYDRAMIIGQDEK